MEICKFFFVYIKPFFIIEFVAILETFFCVDRESSIYYWAISIFQIAFGLDGYGAFSLDYIINNAVEIFSFDSKAKVKAWVNERE